MRDRGAVLLEVLAAVTIFSLAAIVTLALQSQLARHETQLGDMARGIMDQERLLVAHTLLANDDLDRRLGTRRVGRWVVEVQRPEPSLYRIAIGDSSGWDLATMVHRP